MVHQETIFNPQGRSCQISSRVRSTESFKNMACSLFFIYLSDIVLSSEVFRTRKPTRSERKIWKVMPSHISQGVNKGNTKYVIIERKSYGNKLGVSYVTHESVFKRGSALQNNFSRRWFPPRSRLKKKQKKTRKNIMSCSVFVSFVLF